MPLSYKEILPQWHRAKAFGDPRSLKEWSQGQNELYGTQDYAAGLNDGWWKRTSAYLDTTFEDLASVSTEPVGALLGSAIGHEDVGREIGKGTPRMFFDTAALFAGGPTTLVGKAAAYGLAGLGMGAHTYADTDSLKAATISGAAGAFMPVAGQIGGRLALKATGAPKVAGELLVDAFGKTAGQQISTRIPLTSAQRWAEFVGSQTGQVATNVASVYGQGGDPFTEKGVAELVLGQVPFTAFDAVRLAKAPLPKATPETLQAFVKKPETPIGPAGETKAPPVANVPHTDEELARIAVLIQEHSEKINDTTATPAEKTAALSALVTGTVEPSQVPVIKQIVPKDPREKIVVMGYRNPKDNRVLVVGAPEGVEIPEHATMWVNEAVELGRDQNGLVKLEVPRSQLKPARAGLHPNLFGNKTAEQLAQEAQNPELGQRPPGVPPTNRTAKTEPMGAELMTYEVPPLEGEPVLSDADRVTLKEMGVKEPVAPEPTPKNPVPEAPVRLVEELRAHVQAWEEAKLAEEAARAKQDTVPQSAEEWTDVLLGPEATPEQLEALRKTVEEARKSNESDTQALQKALLQKTTKAIDEAKTKQTIARKRSKRLTGEEQVQATQAGFALIEAARRTAELEPESEGASLWGLLKPIINPKADVEAPTANTLDPKVLQRVAVTVYKWQSGMYKNKSLDTLRGALFGKDRGVLTTANKQPSLTIKSVDEQGNPVSKRVYGTETELQQIIEQNGLAEKGVTVESTVRKTKEKEERKFFLGKRVKPVGEVSLDKTVGEGETTIGDIAEPTEPTALVERKARPAVSQDAMEKRVAKLIENPQELADLIVDDVASEEQVKDVVEQLKQVQVFLQVVKTKAPDSPTFLAHINNELGKAGLPKFDTIGEAKHVAGNLGRWLAVYAETYNNFTLDSTIPHDPRVLAEIGDISSPQAVLNWIERSEHVTPFVRDLIRLTRRAADLTMMNFGHILPGSEWHNSKAGFSWGESLDAQRPYDIHIPKFPGGDATSIAQWQYAYAHEFAHQVTRRMYDRNDAPAIEFRKGLGEALEALRNSNQLPTGVRRAIAHTVKENLYAKFVDGKLTSQQVKDEWVKVGGEEVLKWTETIYGLLNEHELIAQVFGSPQLVALTQTTFLPKRAQASVIGWLSEIWNKFVGGGSETKDVLSHILSKYDNYLTGGILRKSYNGAEFIRDSLIAGGVRHDALASRMSTIDEMFRFGSLRYSLDGFRRELKAGLLPKTAVTEGLPEWFPGLVQTATTTVPKDLYGRMMELTMEQVPAVTEVFTRLQEDLRIVSGLAREVREGNVPGSLPKTLTEDLGKMTRALSVMRKALMKHQYAIQRLQATYNLTEEGWSEQVQGNLTQKRWNGPPEEVADADEVRAQMGIHRGKMNPVWKFAALTQHLKEMYPALKAGFWSVFDEQARAAARAKAIGFASIFDTQHKNPDGTVGGGSKELVESNRRVQETESLREATSTLLRWVNKEGKGKGVDQSAPEVRQILLPFNQKDRSAILTYIESSRQQNQVYIGILGRELGRLNIEETALVLAASETGMLPDQARQLSSELYSALAMAVDPAQMAVGQQALAAVATKMQVDTFQKLLKHATGLSQATKEHIDNLGSRPYFVTEQRYDKHHLVMVSPNKKPFRASFETMEALEKVEKQKNAEGYKTLDVVEREDANAPRLGIMKDLVSWVDDRDNLSITRARELGLAPEVLEVVEPLMRRGSDLRDSLTAQSPLPGPMRRFVEGREYIDMLSNQQRYFFRMNNWMRNKLTRARTALDALHPDIATNRELKGVLEQHVNNFLTPDSPVAKEITKAMYFARLGFDLGQMLIESMQSLTTGMTTLVQETGFVGDAFKLWQNTAREIAKHRATGKWTNKEHEQVMELAAQMGVEGLTSGSEVYDPAEERLLDINSRHLSKPRKVWESVTRAATKMSRLPQRFNDRIMLLSAFDIARSKGMAFDEAFAFAMDAKNRSTYTGGKAQRSVGLWSIKTKAVPQLMGALQTYTQGWFGQMGELYQKGFSKNPPPGTTAAQRAGAKKAFAYALIAQATLAGALGLPGIGQGLALFQQSTGIDAKGWIRANLADMFDEDQDYGGILTNFALRGIGSAGLPLDPSNRMAISVPFIGVDPYRGFAVENLFGPVGGTAADVYKGFTALAQGKIADARVALPNALKRPAELWAGEGDIRDKRGGLLYKLNNFERVFMAIGLQPSRISNARDTQQAVENIKRQLQAKQEARYDQMARLMRDGKQDEVLRMLAEMQKENPEGFNLNNAKRQIARRVEAQVTPYDWRRDLNPLADIQGLGQRMPSTEHARLQTRRNVEQLLGLPMNVSDGQDMRAVMMDQLMDSDPYLGRTEAGRQIDRLLRAGR